MSAHLSLVLIRLLMAMALFAMAAGVTANAAATTGETSLLGAWRLDNGRVLTIAPSAGGTWRYRLLDSGRSGRLHPIGSGWQAGPGFEDRDPAQVTFTPLAADTAQWRDGSQQQRARRVAVREREVRFRAEDGTALVGRLVLPQSGSPVPVVVLVHGSERTAAVGQWHEPYLLAAHGIGAFVYDKRGTGASAGAFTMAFATLAADAAAAHDAAARQPGVDARRMGFEGHSQGGWVAPLAASLRPDVDAVLVAYGSASSPFDEDRFQCLLDVPAPDHAAANALVDTSHALVRSGLKDGWDAYQAAVTAVKQRPWFSGLGNCLGGQLHQYPAWLTKRFAPSRLPPQLDWDYDAGRVLAALDRPMLWLIAAADREAPAADTAARIQALAQAGKPYRSCVFADADHGMVLLDRAQKTRVVTGYAPGYFGAVVRYWQQQFLLPPSLDLASPCGSK